MITGLMIILLFTLLFQPDGSRRNACLLFVGLTVSFDVVTQDLPGSSYYLAAACTDYIGMLLLSRLTCDRFISGLRLFFMVSICLNAAGWFIYEAGLSPAPYDLCFVVYYFLATLYMIFMGASDGLATNHSNFTGVSIHRH